VDSQEFRDIIGDATTTGSLASYMSTYNKEREINDAVVNQAEADAPKSVLITSSFMSLLLTSVAM